jgi:hypothetical protein
MLKIFSVLLIVSCSAWTTFFSAIGSLELLAMLLFNATCPLYPLSTSTPSSCASNKPSPFLKIEESFILNRPLGKRFWITAYWHAPIPSLLQQRPLLDARAQTIDVTYLNY